jgi:Zn ribbon nucleic-acid-binding protein
MTWFLGEEGTQNYRSGSLDLPYLPGKESLAERLDEVINRLNLQPLLYEAFAVKRPVPGPGSWWFAFWMDSPLNLQQCSVLYLLFAELSKKSPLYRDRIAPFLASLQIAGEGTLPLNVSLEPPGHVDFGWYTVFAHCPRCKVESPIERWQETIPTELIECGICGQVYSPADTFSRSEFQLPEIEKSAAGSVKEGYFKGKLVDQSMRKSMSAEEEAEIKKMLEGLGDLSLGDADPTV